MVAAGGALGYAVAGLLWLTVTDFGVGLAVASACWVFYGLVRYLQDRDEQRRQTRDEVWQRRVAESRHLYIIEGRRSA